MANINSCMGITDNANIKKIANQKRNAHNFKKKFIHLSSLYSLSISFRVSSKLTENTRKLIHTYSIANIKVTVISATNN